MSDGTSPASAGNAANATAVDAAGGPAGVPRFEGSYLGDRARLPALARMECKICWWVYDPAQGDPQWQVPAGTPFSELPAHWTCPQCEGAMAQFMVLDDGAVG